MRLYDRVIAKADVSEEWYEDLRNAHVIIADNVASFYMLGEKKWGWSDFPNIAPPFSSIFYEARIPNNPVEWRARNLRGSLNITEFGVLWVSRQHYTDTWSGWLLELYVFVASPYNHPEEPFVSFRLAVNREGEADPDYQDWSFGFAFQSMSAEQERAIEAMDQEALQRTMAHMNSILSVTFLATSFLHCKNVELNEVKPSPELMKATLKRHGIPMHCYKVLSIDPMKKILHGQMGNGNSLQKSLHICRGHFKDYRERGLFGKLKGRYWFPQHMRGDVEVGVVEKRYNVNSPQRSVSS